MLTPMVLAMAFLQDAGAANQMVTTQPVVHQSIMSQPVAWDPLVVSQLDHVFSATLGLTMQDEASSDASDIASVEPGDPLPRRFGEKGSKRINVYLSAGFDVQDIEDEMIGGAVGFSHFFEDGLSLEIDFNGFYIEDRSVHSGAFSATATVRWHFHEEPNWTIFAEIGIGLFVATKEVPLFASNFNFTPQAGVGLSYEVKPDVRLLAGVRWHHISNASLYSENPGRDSIVGFVGLSWPY